MITTIVNLLKRNPFIWKTAKASVYALLSLKAWLWVFYYYLWLNFGSKSGINPTGAGTQLVISFTSFGKRINAAHVTAATLLNQSLKPQKVILWLAHGEKAGPKLEKLTKRGLEIRYCDDLRSYKKIIPTLELYPDNIVVTADDDIIYPRNWLAKLYAEHKRHPQDVCCHRAHLLTRKPDGAVETYNNWRWCVSNTDKPANTFPTGAGGVLYPPGSLDPEVTNREAFQELAPYADDIWLKAMSLKQGTISRVVGYKPIRILTSTPRTQKFSALRAINIDDNKNDTQLKAVFTYYDLYKLLD